MDQGDARRRAREISEKTGHVAVADTARYSPSGRITRGGWPSAEQTWAVFDYQTGDLIEMDRPGESEQQGAD